MTDHCTVRNTTRERKHHKKSIHRQSTANWGAFHSNWQSHTGNNEVWGWDIKQKTRRTGYSRLSLLCYYEFCYTAMLFVIMHSKISSPLHDAIMNFDLLQNDLSPVIPQIPFLAVSTHTGYMDSILVIRVCRFVYGTNKQRYCTIVRSNTIHCKVTTNTMGR